MALNITLTEDFLITSDSYNFILNEVRICGTESKNPGERYNRIIGYYPTLIDLLKAFLQINIRESNSTSLKEVIEEIRKVEKIIEDNLGGNIKVPDNLPHALPINKREIKVKLTDKGKLPVPKYVTEDE